MLYCKQCGTKLPDDARFCSACGTALVLEAKPFETHRVLKVSGKPKVTVTNIAPGAVEVKRGSKGEVTIDVDLRVPEDLDWSVSQDGDTITVAGHVRTGHWGWPPYMFGIGPRADFSILVPEEADLSIESRAGRIAIGGVNGVISAESAAGTINMQDCEGTIRARTKAGSVTMENVKGTITARSSAGSIRFNGALSKSESWFRTSLGSIEIALKGEQDVMVEASTNLGSIKCIPELADARYERNRYSGRIGAGAGRLIVETNAGSITIRQ